MVHSAAVTFQLGNTWEALDLCCPAHDYAFWVAFETMVIIQYCIPKSTRLGKAGDEGKRLLSTLLWVSASQPCKTGWEFSPVFLPTLSWAERQARRLRRDGNM